MTLGLCLIFVLVFLHYKNTTNDKGQEQQRLYYYSTNGYQLSVIDAFEIARVGSCSEISTFKEEFYFNSKKGGVISLGMDSPQKDCTLRCDVSIEEKTSTPAWICTGASKPGDYKK